METHKVEVEIKKGNGSFRAEFNHNGQHSALQHHVGNMRDDAERRLALDVFFENIKYVIRQRCFPQDTLIYDVEPTSHGSKLTNPRYPEA
jgi:hypothetical protein